MTELEKEKKRRLYNRYKSHITKDMVGSTGTLGINLIANNLFDPHTNRAIAYRQRKRIKALQDRLNEGEVTGPYGEARIKDKITRLQQARDKRLRRADKLSMKRIARYQNRLEKLNGRGDHSRDNVINLRISNLKDRLGKDSLEI